jgi:hypothetical protein
MDTLLCALEEELVALKRHIKELSRTCRAERGDWRAVLGVGHRPSRADIQAAAGSKISEIRRASVEGLEWIVKDKERSGADPT